MAAFLFKKGKGDEVCAGIEEVSDDPFVSAFERCRGTVPADIDLTVSGPNIFADLGLDSAEELQRKPDLVGLINAQEAYDGLTAIQIDGLKAGRLGHFTLSQLTIWASGNY
jgi:hypothetical protein